MEPTERAEGGPPGHRGTTLSTSIYVGNIPPDSTADDLRDFADGEVIASGRNLDAVFQAAEASGRHPFFICVGREEEPWGATSRSCRVAWSASRGPSMSP